MTLFLVAIIAVVAIFFAFRFVEDVGPLLGRWEYAIARERLVVRLYVGRAKLRVFRFPLASIESASLRSGQPGGTASVRLPGAPPAAPPTTIPLPSFHFGRQRMLGTYASPLAIDVKRRGFGRPLLVITPAEPGPFARDLQRAVAAAHAPRRA